MGEDRQYVDEIYHFKGKWEMPSLCGLRIREHDSRVIFILTELYDENPGNSVTGQIEPLATELVKKYGIDPGNAVFVVHNPERGSKYEFFAQSSYLARMEWDGERFCNLEWEKLGSMEDMSRGSIIKR